MATINVTWTDDPVEAARERQYRRHVETYDASHTTTSQSQLDRIEAKLDMLIKLMS